MRLKRSRAGSMHGEPRTESGSDEVPRSSGIPLRMGEAAKPVPTAPHAAPRNFSASTWLRERNRIRASARYGTVITRRSGGTLLSRIPEMNQECPRWIVSSRMGASGRKVVHIAGHILPSDRRPGAQRGVPRSGLWSEEEIVSSGMAASGLQPEFPARILLRRRIQACLLRCARSGSST